MTTFSASQKQTPPKKEWTEPEKWVWEQLCKGESADFNKKFDKELNPRSETGWNEERLISPHFLETILFEDLYYNKLHRHGVLISGAWVKEKLDLSNARINIEFQLMKSRVEGYVDMTHLHCSKTMSCEGSAFTSSLIFSYAKIESYLNLIETKVSGELDMNTLSVGSSLFMRENSEFNNIMMRSAKIGGHLDLSNAKVTGTLDMDSIIVGSGLVMRSKSEFNEVILVGAKIQGYADLSGTKITGTINMDSVSIGSSLFMHSNAEFNNITLSSASINGQVDMSGVKISGTLNMNSISISSHLFMRNNSLFNQINLISANIEGQVDLSKSKITGTLNMNSLTVGSSLFMRDEAEFNDLFLINAKINGQLDLGKTKISGQLDMSSLSVGNTLFMDDGASFNNVILRNAKVNGSIDMSTTRVLGTLSMESLELGGHLFLRYNSEFENISMLGARIGGQLDMTGARISGELYIESTSIEKNVFLKADKYEGNFSFILSNVNGSVYISDAEISQLDFGGTNIRSELHIGSAGKKIKWKPKSFMNLRNTEVGAIMDAGEDSWPDELNLDGFTYSRLGGLFGHDVPLSKQIAERESKWFVDWMARDKSYSPQPYNQLAGILNKMGYPDKANAVLYAAKNREKVDAKHSRLWLRWFGLSALKWTIGYGFGGRYFRSLIWVTCLTVLGVFVLSTVNINSVPNVWDKIGFSIDMLLPIISLDERYKLDFSGWQLYYFYFHKLMGFLLGSFVVAGLSGITKR
jgi:hypothetical protein